MLVEWPLASHVQKTGDNRAPWKTRGNDNATQEQSVAYLLVADNVSGLS